MSRYVTGAASELVVGDTLLEPLSGCVSTVRRIRTGPEGSLLVVVWLTVGRMWSELTLEPARPVRRRLRAGEEGPAKKSAAGG